MLFVHRTCRHVLAHSYVGAGAHTTRPSIHVHLILMPDACPHSHISNSALLFFFFGFFSTLGGKCEGRQVNIDAHSVPSQPQSIWIHSRLWRANNLEETLTNPTLTTPPHTASLPIRPLHSILLLLFVSAPLKLFCRLFPSLQCLPIFHDTLCSHFMCVFPITAAELLMNIHEAEHQRPLAAVTHTRPPAQLLPLSTGDVMIRSFNKCFYLK